MAKRVRSSPVIIRILDMSTSHISAELNQLLQSGVVSGVYPNEFGYRLAVKTVLHHLQRTPDLSKELYVLCDLARNVGVDDISLDRDGTVYDDLLVHDW